MIFKYPITFNDIFYLTAGTCGWETNIKKDL